MFIVTIKPQSAQQFQLAYAAVLGFFSSCLWILWIASANQVETERWEVLLHLSFPTIPIIMVFEYSYFNKLGIQQTDLHTTVRNGYKPSAINFKSLCGIVCLVLCK